MENNTGNKTIWFCLILLAFAALGAKAGPFVPLKPPPTKAELDKQDNLKAAENNASVGLNSFMFLNLANKGQFGPLIYVAKTLDQAMELTIKECEKFIEMNGDDLCAMKQLQFANWGECFKPPFCQRIVGGPWDGYWKCNTVGYAWCE